jgi:DNA polymerase III subunit delta'
VSKATAAEGRSNTEEEPDRLAGFAAPREVAEIFGQDRARAVFETALQSGRMHHAWMLVGPEGIGKASLAYALARRALSEASGAGEDGGGLGSDDPASPVFLQVAARAHPNLLVLNRSYSEKTKRYSQSIGVDAVRRLRSFLGATAARPGWRVVIVDRADELNQNAANALLKALEEPPEKTVFLLVTIAEGRVPVTIRSRALSLRLQPLAEADLKAAATAALSRAGIEVDAERFLAACRLSEGSVRRALALATGEGIPLYRRIVSAFRALPDLDAVWLQKEAERLAIPANADTLELFFALLVAFIEALVRAAATGDAADPEIKAIAARLIDGTNLGRWAELWEDLNRCYAEALGLNLDKSLLLLESFLRLQRLALDHPAGADA